ncbi:MAG: hypothetical protein EPN34_14195 [Burkholderiaceae bacterium]|nr:MAG: hypothetical protein EPN34_14195 [Burkholderiaceae bacterium]
MLILGFDQGFCGTDATVDDRFVQVLARLTNPAAARIPRVRSIGSGSAKVTAPAVRQTPARV